MAGAAFSATHWSLVARAAGDDAEVRRAALGELLTTYLPALRAHLVTRYRVDSYLADDFLQDFVAKKILEKDLLQLADPAKGKFRTLLLTVLDNLIRDYFRRQKNALSADLQTAAEQPAPQQDHDAFDVAWARSVLVAAVGGFQRDCRRRNQQHLWNVFVARRLRPLATGREPTGYEQLAAENGFSSPKQAAGALSSADRRFRQLLREEIGRYTLRPGDVELEVDELRQVLSAASGRFPAEAMQALADPEPSAASTWISKDPSAMGDLLREHLGEGWNTTDLCAMWKQQQSQTLAEFFDETGGWPEELDAELQGRTLAETIASTQSTPQSLETLQQLKRRARNDLQRADSSWPKPLAQALYFLVIAGAVHTTGRRISKLDDQRLAAGFSAIAALDWLDPDSRDMITEAHGRLAHAE